MSERGVSSGLKSCLTVDLLGCRGTQNFFQNSNLDDVFLQASESFLGAVYFGKHRIELADADRFQCLANFASNDHRIGDGELRPA